MKQKTAFSQLLIAFLFIVTVSYFSYWGYQWVEYILSVLVNVDTGSTFFDLMIGLVAMISSIPVFIGAALAWKQDYRGEMHLKIGAYGFIVKNVLEIFNFIFILMAKPSANAFDIQATAGSIGAQLFQLAFWIFVIVYFQRVFFKQEDPAQYSQQSEGGPDHLNI